MPCTTTRSPLRPPELRSALYTAPPGHLTGHTRILKSGPQTFFNENVAVANAARFYFHANLPSTRLRDVAFDQFKVFTRFTDLCCLHFVLIKCVFFSFAPPWLSYFHRNLFSSRRNFILRTAADQSFAISACAAPSS